MIKRLTVALLLCMLLSLPACGLISPNEREVVSRHYDSTENSEQNRIYKVSDYESLVSTLYDVLTGRVETCVLRFFAYEGDEKSDFERAKEQVLSSAIGKYAVYEMSGTLERIVTFYDAVINVSYKISSTKMSGMYRVSKSDDFRKVAERILREGMDSALLFIEPQVVQTEDMASYFADAYYKNPMLCIYKPTVMESGVYTGKSDEGKIVAVTVGMPDTPEMRKEMLAKIKDKLSYISAKAKGNSTAKRLYSAMNLFGDRLTYVAARSGDRHSIDYTAYGAVVNGKASSEGTALGFKALCDEMRIQCTVVSGKYERTEHFWNIVTIGGEYYHVDAAYCNTRGVYDYFLKSDDDFSEAYSWDRDYYPICDGKPIDYMEIE